MAVRAFDLDLRLVRAEEVPVTMHVDRGVAILAEETSLLARSAVVSVVFNEEIVLPMQGRLLLADRPRSTAIGGLHQSLKAHAYAFAAVVTGRTGLDRNSGVGTIADFNSRLSSGLNAMNQHVTWLVANLFTERHVVALVETLV